MLITQNGVGSAGSSSSTCTAGPIHGRWITKASGCDPTPSASRLPPASRATRSPITGSGSRASSTSSSSSVTVTVIRLVQSNPAAVSGITTANGSQSGRLAKPSVNSIATIASTSSAGSQVHQDSRSRS